MNQNPQETTRQQTRPIRVTVLDHTPIERRIIANLLGREECAVPASRYQQAWRSGGYGPSRPKYTVSSFENAAEALQVLLNPEQSAPDVLLLDLALPVIDGMQVLRQCKETPHLQHMPVIVIVPKPSQPGILMKATRAGAAAHLLRPITEQLLLQTVLNIEHNVLWDSGIWTAE